MESLMMRRCETDDLPIVGRQRFTTGMREERTQNHDMAAWPV